MRDRANNSTISSLLIAVALVTFSFSQARATQTNIIGPAGSGAFGSTVTVLPNGNFVVIDPGYDLSGPTVTDVGAVYLYDGATLTLISTLTGGTASDQVGINGITVLTNGNYVVGSPDWDNPSPLTTDAGAATWGNGATGTVGSVTASNSLVGGTANDNVGGILDGEITALTNGSYVVNSRNWDNPSPVIVNASAVTFGNGTSGTTGLITSANSVVGTVANGTNTFSFDATRNRLFVGRAASNIVSILTILVSVSGRVTTPDGRGLRNAIVSMVDSQGMVRTATTSSFGYYSFEDVEVGSTYVVSVQSRRYRFSPRVIQVFDTLTDVDFIGQE